MGIEQHLDLSTSHIARVKAAAEGSPATEGSEL